MLLVCYQFFQPMEKYFPNSFLTSKHIRQEQTDPISTNRKLQATTSCTSILCQPDEYPNSSCRADALKIIVP
ncbi:hypothetical protein M099_1675 [Phocaeicola vulgatus str. 3975 RP4]|uniref:Uncharacterized protein n=1 Tax=Phocaeicola vulgatus str. 3975 RP4 TaxID=1339352 RepID=A0A069SIU8_PHOVU|nr:hypothetical protein HMPREF9011_04564 [Bacteroides sp. 3_1_40A]EFV65039.1 hypothetical protein HMPREF9011_04518 [Bacteroides sp. 3_1_40A]KDS54577.1 hypothetical protein M099_1675 [Phocaeicola vulgatus str. 3975 RP4]